MPSGDRPMTDHDDDIGDELMDRDPAEWSYTDFIEQQLDEESLARDWAEEEYWRDHNPEDQ